MKKYWPFAAMGLGMLLSVAAVFLMLAAKEKEAEGSGDTSPRSWNLPTGVLPSGTGDGGTPAGPTAGLPAQLPGPLTIVQQINDALSGKSAPGGTGSAGPARPRAPLPMPFSLKRHLTYGFFVLAEAEATAAFRTVNSTGKRGPKQVSQLLTRRLSRPGASTSEVVRVKAANDPGPGVSALLSAQGLPGAFAPLDEAPVIIDGEEAGRRLALLEKALETVGGADTFGQRATLWRVKLLQPELEEIIGPLPPPEEPLRDHQVQMARQAGFEGDARLVRSLHQALKVAVEQNQAGEEKVLLMVKIVG